MSLARHNSESWRVSLRVAHGTNICKDWEPTRAKNKRRSRMKQLHKWKILDHIVVPIRFENCEAPNVIIGRW